MKETIKTSRTAGYLEKIFRSLNQDYFDGELEEAIITIQSTPRAYGHVTVAKAWSRADGEQRHELNIGAGTLDRPIENVVSTVMHEMVHLYNLQHGIQDCSRGGTYHNKRFRDAAEQRDLHISYDSRIGWSITEPTDALIEYILRQGVERDSHEPRGRLHGAGHRRQRYGGRYSHHAQTEQHPQIYLPLLRQQRPRDQDRQHHLRRLHGKHDNSITKALDDQNRRGLFESVDSVFTSRPSRRSAARWRRSVPSWQHPARRE